MRLLKIIIRIILVLIGFPCIVASIGLIYLFITLNSSVQRIPYLDQQIRHLVANKLDDRKLSIDKIRFSAEGASKFVIHLYNCELTDATSKTIFTLPVATVSISTLPLLKGDVHFSNININNLEFTLDKRKLPRGYSLDQDGKVVVNKNIKPQLTVEPQTNFTATLSQQLDNVVAMIYKYHSHFDTISLQEISINIITLNYKGETEETKILLSTDPFVLQEQEENEAKILNLQINNVRMSLVDAKIEKLLQAKEQLYITENRAVFLNPKHFSSIGQRGIHEDLFKSIDMNAIVRLQFHCNYAYNNFLGCGIDFSNMDSKFLSDLISGSNYKIESALDNIDANVTGSLDIQHSLAQELPDISLTLHSDRGYIKDAHLSTQMLPISFKQLDLQLSLTNNLTTLEFERLQATLLDDNIPFFLSLQDDHLHIALQQVDLKHLSLLWPDFLPGKDIKTWVTKHLTKGLVTDASADIYLQEGQLNSLRAQVKFQDADLDYGLNMPTLHKLSGVAKFTDKRMDINIHKGQVLDSQISNAMVSIPNFKTNLTELKINGKIKGNGIEILEHINLLPDNVDSSIWQLIDTQSTLQLKLALYLGLNDDFDFKHHFAINNTVVHIRTPTNFLFSQPSSIVLSINKPYNQDIHFQADLTNAELNYLMLHKPTGLAQQLEFTLVPDTVNKVMLLEDIVASGTLQGQGRLSYSTNVKGNRTLESVFIDDLHYQQNQFTLQFSALDNAFIINGKSLDISSLLKAMHRKNSSIASNLKTKANTLKYYKYLKRKRISSEENLSYYDIPIKPNNLSTQKNINLRINVDKIWLNPTISLDNVQAHLLQTQGVWRDLKIHAKFPGGEVNLIPYLNGKKRYNKSLKYKLTLDNAKSILNTFAINKVEILDMGQIVVKGELYRDKKDNLATSGKIEIKDGFTTRHNTEIEQRNITVEGSDLTQIHNKFELDEETRVIRSARIEYHLHDHNVLDLSSGLLRYKRSGVTIAGTYNLRTHHFNMHGNLVPGYFINNLFSLQRIPIIGSVISFVKGGKDSGLFAVKYSYVYNSKTPKPVLKLYYLESITPGFLRELFNALRSNNDAENLQAEINQ